MADLATTLALLTNDDLGSFQKNVAQDNLLLQLSPALAGIRFNQQTWSPTTSAAGNFAQAFLSTALGEIGRNQVADQTRLAAGLIPQLYANPMGVQAPEGIDMDAFEALKGASTLKKLQRDAAREQVTQDLANSLFAKGAESALTGLSSGNPRQVAAAREMLGAMAADPRAQALGLDKFSGAAMTTPSSYDPLADAESPEVANVDSLRKEYNQRIGNFENVLKAAQAVSGALKDYGRVSDQELVRYSIQMIEPGMAVREGEQAAIANSQSLPSAWKATLEGALTGKSKLPKEVRDGIQRLATRAYDAQKSVYDKATGYYQGLAESRNLLRPDQSISYLGEAPSAESIFGSLSPAPSVSGTSGSLDSGSMKAPGKIDQLTAIRDRLAQGGLSKEEKAQLLDQARQMTVGEAIASVVR